MHWTGERISHIWLEGWICGLLTLWSSIREPGIRRAPVRPFNPRPNPDSMNNFHTGNAEDRCRNEIGSTPFISFFLLLLLNLAKFIHLTKYTNLSLFGKLLTCSLKPLNDSTSEGDPLHCLLWTAYKHSIKSQLEGPSQPWWNADGLNLLRLFPNEHRGIRLKIFFTAYSPSSGSRSSIFPLSSRMFFCPVLDISI